MHFKVSHISREGNGCVDGLANHTLQSVGFSWWDSIPSFIREPYVRDKLLQGFSLYVPPMFLFFLFFDLIILGFASRGLVTIRKYTFNIGYLEHSTLVLKPMLKVTMLNV